MKATLKFCEGKVLIILEKEGKVVDCIEVEEVRIGGSEVETLSFCP